MRRVIAGLVLAAIAGHAAAQAVAPTPIVASAVKWQALPNGMEAAWFVGADGKPGIYALRVKLPAGARIAPHTHPDERVSVVLEGTLYVGFGETFDEARVVAIPAGGVYVAPAGMPHYVWARDGNAVYQESGPGPTSTTFIKR